MLVLHTFVTKILVMKWTENIKRIMADKSISIEQLKGLIEANGQTLSRNSISNILNGNNDPKVETVKMIADALGVELYRLFKTDKAVTGAVRIGETTRQIDSIADLEQLLSDLKGSN